jgi:hypothetical protein
MKFTGLHAGQGLSLTRLDQQLRTNDFGSGTIHPRVRQGRERSRPDGLPLTLIAPAMRHGMSVVIVRECVAEPIQSCESEGC